MLSICSEVNTSIITGGKILGYIQSLQNGSFAKALEAPARFAKACPALSGNILEVHFDRQVDCIDFATRINKLYDKSIADELTAKDFPLPQIKNALFHYGVENLWMEYDAPFKNVPALFFDIDRNSAFNPEQAACCFRKIASLYHLPENTNLLAFLKQINQLGAYVVYYGLMLSRQSNSVRLTINGIEPSNLIFTLKELGWKGNYHTLQKILDVYVHSGQKIVLGVDLGQQLEPRIGLEIFDMDNKAMLEKFHCNRLISDAQFEWFSQWERITMLPDDLANTLSYHHARRIKELHLRINHFKFVIDDTEITPLKGYFYYCF